jgi:hypothetical protein
MASFYLAHDSPGIEDLVIVLEEAQGWAKAIVRARRVKGPATRREPQEVLHKASFSTHTTPSGKTHKEHKTSDVHLFVLSVPFEGR